MPVPITAPSRASNTSTSRNAVGNEGRAVVGHEADGLADAEARRGVPDDPRAERGPVAVELGQGREELVDVALLAVHAAGLRLRARRDDRDVGALPPEPGLADVLGEHPGLVEVVGQYVGVA